MSELVEIILQAIDEASETFQNVSDAAQQTSSDVEGVGESSEGAGEGIESMAGAADLFTATALVDFAQQAADAIWDLADKAGQVQDSMDRASLEAAGFGMSADEMKSTVSTLADETGRAGGQIRESFIKATARGITNMDSFKTMMEGAGAQAYLFNTDIQTMANKFSSMAQKNTLMERSLSETGITMNELADAMGMTGATADEVKAKWQELDTNQRAAILGTAASMNEGKNANESYKNSWQGLHDQIDKAKAKLEVMVGNVLLPVLIPALQLAGRILNGFGDALNMVMNGPLGGFVSVIGAVVAGLAVLVPAIAAVSAGMGFFTATIWPAVAASWALIAPWLPFIAVAALVAVAIYEIGKAFGWWTDVGSLVDAIWAGLQRLWSAFINHPDVQAAIQALSYALSTLWSWIQQAAQAVSEFFGINSSGDYDLVRGLIEGMGAAWEIVSMPIRSVIAALQMLWNVGNGVGDAFGSFWNDTLAPFGAWLSGIFAPVWSLIGDLINAVIPYISNLMNAFTMFANGQMSLPSLIWTVLTTLFNAYVTIFSLIINRVTSWGKSIIAKGISSATSFVNGIINKITALPGRVYNQLMTVVGRIHSAIQAWISAAVSKVHDLVNRVVNVLSSLPGQIASALAGVASAIVKPFQDAYNRVSSEIDKIKSKASELSGGLIAFGGEEANGRQSLLISDSDVASTENNDSIEVNVNEHITLDLSNVPASIDTNTLIRMLQDKNVLRALTGNKDFQSLDNEVKNRILLKTKRTRGV